MVFVVRTMRATWSPASGTPVWRAVSCDQGSFTVAVIGVAPS
ncbi:hypothetical protein STANM309S_02947 [Streptomyces tanashiensis]